MSPDEAAAILGVSLDSSAADIENAYRRRARSTHPDLIADASLSHEAADEFIAVAEAHAVLVARLGISQPSDVPVEYSRPRPRSPLLLVAWAGVAIFAIFVSIYGGVPSWGVWEPMLRYGLILATLLAFAFTGRTPWLVIALLALAATAIITVVATTFGALVGLLLLVAPVYGLVTIGRDVAVRRARWAHL